MREANTLCLFTIVVGAVGVAIPMAYPGSQAIGFGLLWMALVLAVLTLIYYRTYPTPIGIFKKYIDLKIKQAKLLQTQDPLTAAHVAGWAGLTCLGIKQMLKNAPGEKAEKAVLQFCIMDHALSKGQCVDQLAGACKYLVGLKYGTAIDDISLFDEKDIKQFKKNYDPGLLNDI